MIRITASSLSNSLIPADILKLLKALSEVQPPTPSKAIIKGEAPLVSAGPLGAIKDPTGRSAMSILQLGQNQPEAEASASAAAAVRDVPRTAYAQLVEQKYAANNAGSLLELDNNASAQTQASAVITAEATSNQSPVVNLVHPSFQPAVFGEPLFFIPNMPYMQPASRKNRARSGKRRASWRFIFGKREDLEP